MSRINIHAGGLVLDGLGVLVRGPSGAGKSLLMLELLDEWEASGRAASLVADDRIDLERRDDALVMHAPPAIAGLIELRGRGIVHRPFVPTAPLDLVVDLVDSLERMPEAAAFTAEIEGIAVPRCPVPRRGSIDSRHQALLIREALRALGGNLGRGKKIP